jgi:endonuclease/exonuclease/phosphatase family metal-dependent hydrolase
MRIGTYNVLGLKGYPPTEAEKDIGNPLSEATAKHFVNVFDELECGILALQEGVPFPQIQRIAHGMGKNLATFPSPVSWPGHLLTDYPIVESRTFSHAGSDANERPLSRTAGAALLNIDNQSQLWVVVLHLHPSRLELRNQEADILQQRIGALLPITDQMVVLGDFNCEVDERIHSHLKTMGFTNAMEAVGGGIQATMDTVGIRAHRIDHIYFSHSLTPHLTRAEVIRLAGFRHDGPQVPGLWVHSDHLPVVAELNFGSCCL